MGKAPMMSATGMRLAIGHGVRERFSGLMFHKENT